MTTTTTEAVPYEHGDPRIGSMVDTDTWRAVPAPKIDDGDPLDRLGGYCVIAGDSDEADVWIEVTAEYPKDVAEFIVQAVRNEHGREVSRCGSCEHETSMHHASGCWFSVTVGQQDRNLVCPCTVSRGDA